MLSHRLDTHYVAMLARTINTQIVPSQLLVDNTFTLFVDALYLRRVAVSWRSSFT